MLQVVPSQTFPQTFYLKPKSCCVWERAGNEVHRRSCSLQDPIDNFAGQGSTGRTPSAGQSEESCSNSTSAKSKQSLGRLDLRQACKLSLKHCFRSYCRNSTFAMSHPLTRH